MSASDQRLLPITCLFGATIFLGAFLMFEVELLMGKFVLPWFGGAAAVWTTCMFCYQLFLLGGYGYAHLLSRWPTSTQARIHIAIVVLSLGFLVAHAVVWPSPVTPGETWAPHDDHPIQNIVLLLAVSIGFPFFLLAATGPLLQQWFANLHKGSTTYRFYAVSNLGSLLGLISHPLLIEPYIGLSPEGQVWAVGYLGFVLGSIWCAKAARRTTDHTRGRVAVDRATGDTCADDGVAPPRLPLRLLWFSLAACGSLILLATTNALSEAVASVPLLWALPLGLYLLSFSVSFAGDRFYRRSWAHPAFVVTVFAAYVALSPWGALLDARNTIVIYGAIVFFCSLVCHGELARLAPHPRYLTSFYLIVAAGGAAGGMFSSLVAPMVFPDFWELQLGLGASALLLTMVLFRDRTSWVYVHQRWVPLALFAGAIIMWSRVGLALIVPIAVRVSAWQLWALGGLGVLAIFWRPVRQPTRLHLTHIGVGVLLVMLAVGLESEVVIHQQDEISQSRNFYGVLTVRERHPDSVNDVYELYHGVTLHGMQFLDPARRQQPTSYYGPSSGVALALRYHPRRISAPLPQPLRIGVVGLGVGTVAAFAHPGDYIRFYEINPEVIRMSEGMHPLFSYVEASAGTVDFVEGDARVSLAAERDRGALQRFDILVLDAFESDAVPIHLLTEEAFELYLQHLRDDNGILALNTSSRFLDFEPELATLAEYLGLTGTMIHSAHRGDGLRPNHWILLSRSRTSLSHPTFAAAGRPLTTSRIPLWTDQHSNILAILR